MKKNFIVILLSIILLILLDNDILYIPCIFHFLTNLYCPGCGITRMFLSIFRLNFYQAFRYNQLIFIVLPFIVFILVNYIYSLKYKKIPLIKKIPEFVWYIFIVVFILFGIIRNIFPYFAPTKIY